MRIIRNIILLSGLVAMPALGMEEEKVAGLKDLTASTGKVIAVGAVLQAILSTVSMDTSCSVQAIKSCSHYPASQRIGLILGGPAMLYLFVDSLSNNPDFWNKSKNRPLLFVLSAVVTASLNLTWHASTGGS